MKQPDPLEVALIPPDLIAKARTAANSYCAPAWIVRFNGVHGWTSHAPGSPFTGALTYLLEVQPGVVVDADGVIISEPRRPESAPRPSFAGPPAIVRPARCGARREDRARQPALRL